MDFLRDDESKLIYSKFSNKIKNLYYSEVANSKFLTPNHVELVKSICNKYNIIYKIYKSNNFSERDIIFFSETDFDLENIVEETVSIIVIKNKSMDIKHRDVLGSILNLGIDRANVGDIVFNDDLIYIVIMDIISDFILLNLKSIKRYPVSPLKYEYKYITNKFIKTEEKKLNVSSLRLDVIVSSMINISRAKSKTLFKRDLIKLNHYVENNPSISIKENDLISIRGYGRFIFSEILGTTRKNKYVVSILKLV